MTDEKRKKLTLVQLGWRPFYQQQVGLDEWEYPVARVIAHHRDRLELLGECGKQRLDLMSIEGTQTYGGYFTFAGPGPYTVVLTISRQGATKVITLSFPYEHRPR